MQGIRQPCEPFCCTLSILWPGMEPIKLKGVISRQDVLTAELKTIMSDSGTGTRPRGGCGSCDSNLNSERLLEWHL